MVYIFYVSFKFYGKQNLFGKILDDPVYFIFPLLTSISFYEREEPIEEQNNLHLDEIIFHNTEENQKSEQNVQTNESVLPSASDVSFDVDDREEQDKHENNLDFDNIIFHDLETQELEQNVLSNQSDVSVYEEQEEEEHQNKDNEEVLVDNSMSKQFSVHQSNILYFLFVMSFGLIMGADIALQRVRWSGIWAYGYESLTFKYLLIFLLNFCLWVDFIRGTDSQGFISLGPSNLHGNQQLQQFQSYQSIFSRNITLSTFDP